MIKFKLTVKTDVRREDAADSAEREWSVQSGDNAALSGPAGLPRRFEPPQEFRRRLERSGGPVVPWPVPAPVVFTALIAALAWWCYYGYEYNQEHFPVSLTALLVFSGVLLLLLVAAMYLWARHKQRRMYPVLQRLAAQRPGAFLASGADAPALCYATAGWIGRVGFEEGGEGEDAFTRLEARLRRPAGRLEIRNRRLLDRFTRGAQPQDVPWLEGDFGRKFVVESPDPTVGHGPLDATVAAAVTNLAQLGKVRVHLDRDFLRVEVARDLSPPRRARALETFLNHAETIVAAAAR